LLCENADTADFSRVVVQL